MSSKSRRLLGLVVLGAILGPLAVDGLYTSDEERLLAALDAIEHALEARDADAAAGSIAPDVVVSTRIPFVATHEGLLPGLRSVLRSLDALTLERDGTTFDFPEADLARVQTNGHGWVRRSGFEAPFQFDVDAEFARTPDDRFELVTVHSVRIRHPLAGSRGPPAEPAERR